MANSFLLFATLLAIHLTYLADKMTEHLNNNDREILVSMLVAIDQLQEFGGSNVTPLPTNTRNTKMMEADKVRDFWKTASVADIDIYLAAGGDVNARDDIGRTPLYSSLMGGNVVATQHLIEQGANMEARDMRGETALHHAASLGGRASLDAVRVFLEAAPAPTALLNQKDPRGERPLHHAAGNSNGLMAKELIAQGADIDARDNNGRTPLHRSATVGASKPAEVFLASGANIEALTLDGETPLQIAANHSAYRMVQFLTNAGAKVEDVCNMAENVALFLAAESGETGMVQTLLREGVADIDCQDGKGNTPLHIATFYGHLDTVAALIDGAANCKTVNHDGDTPLHLAVMDRPSATDIISLLLAANVDIDARNDRGETPLHKTCNGAAAAMKQLVDARANIEARDIFGGRPLHNAVYRYNKTCVRVLIDAGADVNAQDDEGLTPRECLLVSKIPAIARITNEIEKMLSASR